MYNLNNIPYLFNLLQYVQITVMKKKKIILMSERKKKKNYLFIYFFIRCNFLDAKTKS